MVESCGRCRCTHSRSSTCSFPHIGGDGFHVLAFTEPKLERDKVTPSDATSLTSCGKKVSCPAAAFASISWRKKRLMASTLSGPEFGLH